MRAYVTSRGHSGVSFGIVGTVLYAFGYLLYVMVVGLVLAVVALAMLCRELYRWYQRRKLPPPPSSSARVNTSP